MRLPTLVPVNGQYETIPLEKDVVRLAVVQSMPLASKKEMYRQM